MKVYSVASVHQGHHSHGVLTSQAVEAPWYLLIASRLWHRTAVGTVRGEIKKLMLVIFNIQTGIYSMCMCMCACVCVCVCVEGGGRS